MCASFVEFFPSTGYIVLTSVIEVWGQKTNYFDVWIARSQQELVIGSLVELFMLNVFDKPCFDDVKAAQSKH